MCGSPEPAAARSAAPAARARWRRGHSPADTHPLVRLALGLGPLSRDGFECARSFASLGSVSELLLQGGGEEIALGLGGQ